MKKACFLCAVLFGLACQVFGQLQASLSLNENKELQVYGRTNGCYQVQHSTNLVQWFTNSSYFAATYVPYQKSVTLNGDRTFVRVRALDSVNNLSYSNDCAEDDNVNTVFMGVNVTSFWITATHPTNYVPVDYTCTADFTDCEPGTNTNYSFPYFLDNNSFGGYYMIRHRDNSWWRPQGMNVTVNGGSLVTNINYIEIGRNIPATSEWPIYFVLYSDGNMRLIPFPPVGHPSICFGSSVIIGPAPIGFRPVVDIASVDLQTVTTPYTLFVTYRSGGTAIIDFTTVSRTGSTVKVAINYPTAVHPFCTYRSMFVRDGNSDCDYVRWKDVDGEFYKSHIMSFDVTAGTEWQFYRETISIHNQTCPDIKIVLK